MATLVEGDPNLDPYLILPTIKQGGIKYPFSFFRVFSMTQPGIEPQSSRTSRIYENSTV